VALLGWQRRASAAAASMPVSTMMAQPPFQHICMVMTFAGYFLCVSMSEAKTLGGFEWMVVVVQLSWK
jgi:hypothetical protein